MGWWLGLAPATLEFWVRFPNERNQGKQAHPVLKYRVPHGSQCVMGRLVHTGLGTSSLVAHVLHYPPPPHANSFVLGPAVINTHTNTHHEALGKHDLFNFAGCVFVERTKQKSRALLLSTMQCFTVAAQGKEGLQEHTTFTPPQFINDCGIGTRLINLSTHRKQTRHS